MKTFVVVPTYNESENILRLIEAIFDLQIPDLSVLLVDDHSPDGTGKLIEQIMPRFPSLYLAERLDDKGRGTAGITGFAIALELGADAIVEMDADFSHPPETILNLLEQLEKAPLVIASRRHPNSEDQRPRLRRWITRLSNLYIRWILKTGSNDPQDWTSGFRAYRREVFEKIPVQSMISDGPSLLQEILYRALLQHCPVAEIPFKMIDRRLGKSSFTVKIALQSLLMNLFYRLRFSKKPVGFTLSKYRIQSDTWHQNPRHFRITQMPGINTGIAINR